MPIVKSYTTAQNIGTMGNRTNQKKVPYQYFQENPLQIIKNPKVEIEFYSKNDVLLFRIPEGVRDTLLNSLEFNYDFRGCADLVIRLLSATPFPLVYGTKIRVVVSGIIQFGKVFYTGYLFNPDTEFNSKKDVFEYKFFGMRKRYEKQEISLDIYPITSISKSGANITVYTSGSIPPTIIMNQKVAIRRTDNQVNTGYYSILSYTTNSVTFVNSVGAIQTGAGGDFVILPYAWSVSSLVSDVFKSIALLASAAFGIGYNISKIQDSVGKTTDGMIDFNEVEYDKAFEILEKRSADYACMGVDEYGDFFYTLIPEKVLTVLNTGYDIADPGLSLNYNNIANVITGERIKERGETGSGFIVAAVAGPLSDVNLSIAKHGTFAKRIQLPAYLSDETIQAIVDADLQQNKDPRYSSKISDMQFDRFYPVGDYDICPLPDVYTDIVDECDTLTNWSHDTHIMLINNTSVLITGNGSLQVDVTTASSGEDFTLTLDYTLEGKKTIELWLRASMAGNYLTIRITDGVTTENYPLYIGTINQFYRVIIDISNSALTKLTEIKFVFGTVTENITLYIDEVSIKKYTARHIRVPFKKANYKLFPHRGKVSLEFGLESEKLSEFLQSVQMQQEIQKIGARNR
jgi:hypothetical protein